MHRLVLRGSRTTVLRPAVTARTAVGQRTKIDQTSVGNDSDPAMKKGHEDAKRSQGMPEPLSEGHSLDRMKNSRKVQDQHTQELDNATRQRELGSSPETAETASKEASRQAHRTPASKAYQPGQEGEQIGGAGSPKDGKQPGEGMAGKEDAPKTKTGSGLGQFVKNLAGTGGSPTNGFHTYARARFPSRAVPDEAVDKGARKPKDTGVGAAQTPHLPHHAPGQGDKMPAVKNNAALPSKQGNSSGGSPPDPQKKQWFHTAATQRQSSATGSGNGTGTGTNTGRGPSAERRPTGTADTPGSRVVSPESGVHSPSFAPSTGSSASYTHVKGTPEPDSHQTAYQYSTTSGRGGVPSGTAPRSSTSASPYPDHDAMKGIKKNEAGVGSSNKMHEDPLKPADEMVGQMKPEVGQAGDDAGGRAYTPPPDVGSNIEDTLPKPLKK